MEPAGLALTRMPFSLGSILFLVIVAGLVFFVAHRTTEDEE